MSNKSKPPLTKTFILWPNGRVFKAIIFPLLIVWAYIFLQAYLRNIEWKFVLSFSIFILVPLLVFSWPFRFVVKDNKIEGPDLNKTFHRTAVNVSNAEFFLEEKTWGVPSFRIRDKVTHAEIGSFYIYFSKSSLIYLKELIAGR